MRKKYLMTKCAPDKNLDYKNCIFVSERIVSLKISDSLGFNIYKGYIDHPKKKHGSQNEFFLKIVE